MKTLFTILFLLISSTANAESILKLPRSEYIYQTFHYIDLAQTLNTSDKNGQFRETNPFLGKNPTQDDVIGFFVATSIAHAAVTKYLMNNHPEYVKPWQYTSIAVKSSGVIWNFKVLLK